MILEAAEKHGLDLASSWMIGDNESDIQAGQNAGCRTILVGKSDQTSDATFRVDSIEKLPNLLKDIL